MDTFSLTLANFEQENKSSDTIGLNKFIGNKLSDVILNNIGNEKTKIIEYDWQIIEDSTVIFKLVDAHYLCLNKIYVKSFYKEWRDLLLSNEVNTAQYDAATLCVLLINPNVATAWSKRKWLVDKNMIDLTRELEFNRLILVKHVKCECAYIHRRWLVKRLTYLDDFLMIELEFFFESLCFKIKANYYCWSYLNWILFFVQQNLLSNETKIKSIFEWFFTKLAHFVYLNPSDNCLFHTRLNLITRLHNDNVLYEQTDEDFSCFVSNELELFDDLLLRYTSMSTIWNYRKYFSLFLSNHKHRKLNIDFKALNKLVAEKLKNKQDTFSSINESHWFESFIQREICVCEAVTSSEQLRENFLNFINKFVKV